MTQEAWRLKAAEDRTAHWRRWGPYLSERQWGTVREDYSPTGTAWDFFPMIMLVREPTVGVKTASPGSPITTSGCVLPWHSGMAVIRS
jgi:hypothetical protein